MYARVVRFKDIDIDQVNEVARQVEGGEGPPPGVPAKGIRMIVDEAKKTSVVVVFFDSEEDMKQGGEALDAMDTSETPGTRESVDTGELKASADM